MESSETALPELQALAERLARGQQADILLYRGDLVRPVELDLLAQCSRRANRRQVLLTLSTVDGSADVAFRVARCLQRHYRRLTLYVDDACKGVGMLLALAADEIVLSDFGELGPLVLDGAGSNESGQPGAGATSMEALQALRSQALDSFEDTVVRLRARRSLGLTSRGLVERASDLTIGLFGPLYGQLDLLQLGEADRSIRTAWGYAERLARGNLQEGAVERLTTAYPAPNFVIDRDEARGLFRQVRAPSREEAELLKHVEPILAERRHQRRFIYLDELLATTLRRDQPPDHDGEPSPTAPTAASAESASPLPRGPGNRATPGQAPAADTRIPET